MKNLFLEHIEWKEIDAWLSQSPFNGYSFLLCASANKQTKEEYQKISFGNCISAVGIFYGFRLLFLLFCVTPKPNMWVFGSEIVDSLTNAANIAAIDNAKNYDGKSYWMGGTWLRINKKSGCTQTLCILNVRKLLEKCSKENAFTELTHSSYSHVCVRARLSLKCISRTIVLALQRKNSKQLPPISRESCMYLHACTHTCAKTR